MYCPIYDWQECIGYAGAAVYADQLMNALLDLELKSLPKSSYVFMLSLIHISEPTRH